MSGQITDYFAEELLKLAFQRDTYTPPYNQFLVCLTTVIPAVNADESQLVEPVGNGYARQAVPFTTANWTLSGFREIYNANEIVFPQATGYWGTVAGYAVLTDNSGSSITRQTVAVGGLAIPLKVPAGVQPAIAVGTISFGIYD